VETFAPPIIASKGLCGFFNVSSRYSISFSIRNPQAGSSKYEVTPSTDACALCAEPNASFT
jgi:hypothetical protein